MKLDKVTYMLILAVTCVCIWKGLILYHWLYLGEIEMSNSPGIYKSVKYPIISVVTLLISLPSLMVLLIPSIRTIPVVLFVSGALVVLGVVTICLMPYVSINVAGGSLFFIMLGQNTFILAKKNHELSKNA